MNRFKIAFCSIVLVAACFWLAVQGYGRAKTYYRTVQELLADPAGQQGKSLRVGGDVQQGSVQKSPEPLRFALTQDGKTLPVVYVGTEPLPDTFSDRAQAVVDGTYDAEKGVFLAEKIQAKCASKYESKGPRTLSSFQPPHKPEGEPSDRHG